MSGIHYFKDIPSEEVAVEHYELDRDGIRGVVAVTERVQRSLACYDGTLPTAPSDGRVYLRHGWFMWVRDEPGNEGWQLHLPYELVVVA